MRLTTDFNKRIYDDDDDHSSDISGQLLLHNADFMARCLSTVTSDGIRYAHFAMELLCLREHSWELSNNSNNSMSLN